MPNVGPVELIVVLVVALLVLGPKRLPEAGRALGRGLREFKDGVKHADPREIPVPEPSLPAADPGE